MKKILIISYYFPPANYIAANRPKSFAENFKKYGLSPTVITRHWDGDENGWEDLERINTTSLEITEHESYTLIQLPCSARWYNRFCRSCHRITFLKRFFHLTSVMLGIFGLHQPANECFYDYLQNYLKKNKVNFLMVTSPPLNIVKLGHLLSEEFQIPLIVDFRDLWDNGLLDVEHESGLEDRVKNFFYEFYFKKWLKGASLIASVSGPLVEEIKRLRSDVKTLVVMNGFEKELFDELSDSAYHINSKFTFSTVGTLYPEQDLSVLIEGLKLFLKDKDLREIQLNFIGTGSFPEVRLALEKNLPQESTLVTGRIPREQALQKTLEADILFYAGWKGYKGRASGKIFEYLGAGKNVLIAPSDNDIIEKIVLETGAGKLADSPQEFAQILNQWFEEWKTKGRLSYKGDVNKIEFYSRENQAEIYAREIMNIKE